MVYVLLTTQYASSKHLQRAREEKGERKKEESRRVHSTVEGKANHAVRQKAPTLVYRQSPQFPITGINFPLNLGVLCSVKEKNIKYYMKTPHIIRLSATDTSTNNQSTSVDNNSEIFHQ